ncbi:restriction endonuclease subunit S [Niastella koreensis]|uniref:restriction endonuclease subunit S n=1 Tax=Niastella koreensis TaxID=354356 RepID=UPI001054682D|nr:restriction endonuclease subunit S [Niastella koreensis]
MKKKIKVMYNISSHINTDKIFIVKRSELEDRFDATFYKEGFDFLNFIRLSKIARVSGGKRLPEGYDFSNEPTNYRYLRVGDVNRDGTLNYGDFKYLPKDVYTILKRYEIFKNDLLIAIVGATVGKVALMNIETDENIILTENCAKITLKDKTVLPEYLFILLQSPLIQKQIQLNYIQTTLPKLGLDRVGSLYIPPIPSIKIQNEIVKVFSKAFNINKQKEAEAKAILESIDTYILKELGISLPEQNNTLQDRIFTAKFSEVVGGRLDPLFYNSDLSYFSSGVYESLAIGSLTISLKSGFGVGRQDQADEYDGIIQIRPTNIDEFGQLIFDRNIYVPRTLLDKVTPLEVGDVLFNNTNSQELVGKTALFAENKSMLYSNHITVIKVKKEKVLPEFLWMVLNSYQKHKVFYSLCTNWNNQSGIGLELLKSIKIPVPNIGTQKTIVNHVANIFNSANRLKEQAAEILFEAKQKVEQMLISK